VKLICDVRRLGRMIAESRCHDSTPVQRAKTFGLPEWLRKLRPDLAAAEQIARWQRIVDHLVVAGDYRMADQVG
jgi:hypothetical protein